MPRYPLVSMRLPIFKRESTKDIGPHYFVLFITCSVEVLILETLTNSIDKVFDRYIVGFRSVSNCAVTQRRYFVDFLFLNSVSVNLTGGPRFPR